MFKECVVRDTIIVIPEVNLNSEIIDGSAAVNNLKNYTRGGSGIQGGRKGEDNLKSSSDQILSGSKGSYFSKISIKVVPDESQSILKTFP